MDDIDYAIIHELARDARIPNTTLADRVGLTPGPCLRRVQRLEADGVIRGYHADLDPAAVGQGFEVLIEIELTDFSRESVDVFETTMSAHPEVIELYRLFGSPDYFARVAVADLAAYDAFHVDKVLTIPGIQRVSSRFPMRILKSARDRG